MTMQTPTLVPDIVRQDLALRRDAIEGALAGQVPVDRFLAACAAAISSDPKVADCQQRSIVEAVLTCATMGLTPATSGTPQVARRVALIPRGGQCTVLVEWRGLLELLHRQPGVVEAYPVLVLEGDEFSYDADNRRVTHGHDPLGHDIDKGLANVRGGYLRMRYADGRVVDHVTPGAHIRRVASMKESGPVWKAWPAEMALKTCIRYPVARGFLDIDADEPHGMSLVTALHTDVIDVPHTAAAPMAERALTYGEPPVVVVASKPTPMTEAEAAEDLEREAKAAQKGLGV